MRFRSKTLRPMLFAALLCCGGCKVPDYYLPGGFSSSYYRHLSGGSQTLPPPASVEANGTAQSGVFATDSERFALTPPDGTVASTRNAERLALPETSETKASGRKPSR